MVEMATLLLSDMMNEARRRLRLPTSKFEQLPISSAATLDRTVERSIRCC